MNGKRILFRWEQKPTDGYNGTLILWPGTSREMRLEIENFATANTLGMRINEVTKDAYAAGRRSMKADVANIKE